MSGAANPTRRYTRWGAFTDAELQLLADTLHTTAHPQKYLYDMYGAPALEMPKQIAAELARRGYQRTGPAEAPPAVGG